MLEQLTIGITLIKFHTINRRYHFDASRRKPHLIDIFLIGIKKIIRNGAGRMKTP